jgi:hypothetical protein
MVGIHNYVFLQFCALKGLTTLFFGDESLWRIRVYDSHFHNGWTAVDLTFKERLRLAVFGRVYLRHDAKPGWRGKLPFYIVRCPQHGYFLDYPHGWKEHFYCPLCMEELTQFAKDLQAKSGFRGVA